ncbi:hypothetical protein ACEVJK_01780 [Flintibacter sp. P01028]|uniref:hypothetical protein n=1 Tax=Flintibacter sp. P01028 TaxID=3342382 RepID=UPI0035B5DEBC
MKQRSLACLAISAALLLSGCSSMLDREYLDITTHNAAPTTEGDTSILRADSYQELVNVLIYMVSTGAENGTIRLYIDSEDVAKDLEDACREVVQEDPLGAYAVEYIKHSVDSIVTYSEAQVQIIYRRTREQVASIVSATGAAAIRGELEESLASFAPESVLRLSYFDGDEAYILDLVREAYFATPATALDLPEATVAFYPDSGSQRVVEISLHYHLDEQELVHRREVLDQTVQKMTAILQSQFFTTEELLPAAAQAIHAAGGYDPEGGSTAYHALLEKGADDQGLALAAAMVYNRLDISCQVIEGSLDGAPHFWNVIQLPESQYHLDLSQYGEHGFSLLSSAEMEQRGYLWDPEDILPR